jgi:hypothetical protein
MYYILAETVEREQPAKESPGNEVFTFFTTRAPAC